MTEITPTATNPFSMNAAGVVQTDKEANNLGQKDFLELLTAQLQNQDPLSPMDNAEFLSQMAQFSTVEGLDRINSSIGSLSDSMGNNQVNTAASLLGHSVLVPGNLARPDANGEIHGMAELTETSTEVTVSYTDPETDEVLYTQNLGAHSEGWVDFGWTEVPAELAAQRGQVRVTVNAVTGNGTYPVTTSVFSPVQSAIGGPTSEGITLMVEDYGALDTLEVTAFR